MFTFKEWFGLKRQLSGNVNVNRSSLSLSWRIVQPASAILLERLVFSIRIYFPCASHSATDIGPFDDLWIVVRDSRAIEKEKNYWNSSSL
jgi:hypothetical protein